LNSQHTALVFSRPALRRMSKPTAPKVPPSTADKLSPGRNNACPAMEFLGLQFAATKPSWPRPAGARYSAMTRPFAVAS
jgi:hypothetical protein